MDYLVYFEGLDKTGKTTLFDRLRGFRPDRLTFIDRGPWSRYVYYRFGGDMPRAWAMEALLQTRLPPSIVVLFTRDLDLVTKLQRGDENFSRAQLEEQQGLFREVLTRLPPTHLFELVNDRPVPELEAEIQRRLDELLARATPTP